MKIIIIGKGIGWDNAPMEGEIWGINDLIMRRPVKLAFEMHDIDKVLDGGSNYHAGYSAAIKREIDKINELGIPVITQKKHKLLPSAIPFPIDEMPILYFTSSVAYTVAYAIYKEATQIDIYGVPFLYKNEYIEQRPCVEFWVGYAMGKGIKVNFHKPTTMFSAIPHMGLYGYEWDNLGMPDK